MMYLLPTLFALAFAGHSPVWLEVTARSECTACVLFTITSAEAGATGGETQGELSSNGGVTVTQIEKNGNVLTEGVDYEIKGGSDGSSNVGISFTDPLVAGDKIEVTGTTPNSSPTTTLTLS